MTSEDIAVPLAKAVQPCTKTSTFLQQALAESVALGNANSTAWQQSPLSLCKRVKKMKPAVRACGTSIAFHHAGCRSISVTRQAGFTKLADRLPPCYPLKKCHRQFRHLRASRRAMLKLKAKLDAANNRIAFAGLVGLNSGEDERS
ncbi:hypothetical protein RCH14_002781 [Massilia sp. MP_M2]|uniref:hypothetical protein n=1 Tax=Massilia sp. MP_M2 TaxID=3071713 RepID=UPI00319E6C28